MVRRLSEHPDSIHSWIVALTGAVAMVFTFGTPISYAIFRESFHEVFGLSPIGLSVIFSAMLFSFTVGSGIVGIFGVNLPARAVLLGCAVITAVLAPSLYVTSSIIGLLVVFTVLGLAMGSVFIFIASIVPQWFRTHRGTATGLIFVGNGLGLFLLPPLWQFVFAELGVRRGFLLVISISAVAFLIAGLFCRRPSWSSPTAVTIRELLQWAKKLGNTRTFQLLFVGLALAFAWYPLLAAYAVDLFMHRGLSYVTASFAFGLVGGVSIISRIGGGYLADVVGSRRAFLGSFICVILGVALLFIPTVPTMATAVLLTGLGLGGTATLYIPLIMNIYSAEKDTAIIGLFNLSGGVVLLTVPPIGTASVAYTGSYTVVILLTLFVTIIGTVSVALGTTHSTHSGA